MTPPAENLTQQLQHCISLAQSVETHGEAKQQFEQLRQQINDSNPELVSMLDLLWKEILTAYRSVGFWQQMSEVEKEMASNMMDTMTQMRQNYLRLMQEL